MKKYPLVFCLVFLCLGTYCQQPGKQKIINAADYNLDASDATPAVLRAMDDCKKNKAGKLIIPKGDYHFYSLKATERGKDDMLQIIRNTLKQFIGYQQCPKSHPVFLLKFVP